MWTQTTILIRLMQMNLSCSSSSIVIVIVIWFRGVKTENGEFLLGYIMWFFHILEYYLARAWFIVWNAVMGVIVVMRVMRFS